MYQVTKVPTYQVTDAPSREALYKEDKHDN